MSSTKKKKERVNWVVRPSTPDDAKSINRLFAASWRQLLNDCYSSDLISKTLPALEDVRAKDLLTCGTYYVVCRPDDNAIVGAGGWTMDHPIDTGTNYPHIRHIATSPACLQQGVAKAIWQQCWNDIVESSGSSMTTVEVLSTIPARKFYEQLGFRYEKEMGVPVDETTELPCLYMLRKVEEL